MGSAEYLAVHDGRGSVGAWYSATTGRVAAALDYTPEGRATWRTFDSGGGTTGSCDEVGTTSTCAAALGVPFAFHSALKSEGTGLLYFRNRWYSTTAGQWLSQDPLGPVDSHNLYAFNGFDSVNFVDPWGLNKGPAGPAVEGRPNPNPPNPDELQDGWSIDLSAPTSPSSAPDSPGGPCVSCSVDWSDRGPGVKPQTDFALVGPPPTATPPPVAKPPGPTRPPQLPGPRGPGLRPDPVTMGVGVGLLICSQLPGCSENLVGIGDEFDRMVDEGLKRLGREIERAAQPKATPPLTPPATTPPVAPPTTAPPQQPPPPPPAAPTKPTTPPTTAPAPQAPPPATAPAQPPAFPGTDPTKAPPGFDWKGRPGSTPGSSDGNF